jgi:putative transposase
MRVNRPPLNYPGDTYRRLVSRAPRIEVPGRFYHLVSRGNRGSRIYADDEERRVFLQLLGRVARSRRWICHAYCLMSNHYHLLVQIQQGGLSDGMRELNGGFARFRNDRHDEEGHLFRNRFWSDVLEEEAHMLEACRYVVLNPVRARLCNDPADWRWSSYRACAGLEYAPGFLAMDRLLRVFGPSPTAARRAYRTFVRDGIAGAVAGVRHGNEVRARFVP